MAKKRFTLTKREFINILVNIAVMLAVVAFSYLLASLIEWTFNISKWSEVGKYFVIIASYSIIKSLHNYGK